MDSSHWVAVMNLRAWLQVCGVACALGACAQAAPGGVDAERRALAQADAAESCDGGCESEDDPATPGDDRAGYVHCQSARNGSSLTCGPSLGCCPDPTNAPEPVCAHTRQACGFVQAFMVFCDGPEDCAGAGACMITRTGRSCGNGYYTVCHADRDCPAGQPSCGRDGLCRAAP